MQGKQLINDPYVQIFPDITNENYDSEKQKDLVKQGFVQFIPICTVKNSTSYDYSISVNDDNTAFDAYFVASENQLDNYLKNDSFTFYSQSGCYATNKHSFSGTCNNVDQNAGLLVVIPDNLKLSLTKIKINIHEILE